MKSRSPSNFCGICALALVALVQSVCAQETAFTYQGRLTAGGNAANGSYDLRLILYSADIGGSQTGNVLTNTAVTISNGLFATVLDFGGAVFDGNARWLEIAVRTNGSGSFVPLFPRQPLTPTPYAIRALDAATAQTVPDGAVTSTKILDGTVVNADIAASAAIADTKLATITTAGKVANSATTASSGNTANAIVVRDGAGGFSAGAVTANSFSGSGAALTSLNASQLTSGTATESRIDAALARDSEVLSLMLSQDGVGSTLDADFLDGQHASSFASASHNHAAANITSGTLADARLSANVALLNGNQTFTGTNIFLRTAGTGKLIVDGAVAVDTNMFTGLSLQYDSTFGEGAILSSYKDGFASMGFYTKAGPGLPVAKRMVIDRYGQVGIGTNGPQATLHVLGKTNSYVAIQAEAPVRADGFAGTGVYGRAGADGGTGVEGDASGPNGTGVAAFGGGFGVWAISTNVAVYASGPYYRNTAALSTPSRAGDFYGDVGINDHDLYFRPNGDTNHGVGFYGGSKPFATENINGPVLYGYDAGGLGTRNGGDKLALTWNNSGTVIMGGDVFVPGYYYCKFGGSYLALNKDTAGSLPGNASWTSSDQRLKQDIATIPDALGALQKLRGVTYLWNQAGLQHLTRNIETQWKSASGKPEDNQKLWTEKRREAYAHLSKPQMGFIAQEVEQVFPDWVTTDEQGFKRINMEHLNAVMLDAIKEQQAQIESQQRQIATLMSSRASLEQRLATLEKWMRALDTAQVGGGR